MTSTMKKERRRDRKAEAKREREKTPLREYVTLEKFLSRRAEERAAKRKTSIVDYFPDIHTMREPVYHGLLSWTLPERCERWIKAGAVVNIGYGIQTATDVTRDYLDWKFPRRLRATNAQIQAIKAHRSAPLYVEPTVLEDGVYVDLASAYWSIIQIVGWNVDYYPGQWLVAGETCDDFPLATHKVARNSLVSAGLSTPVKYWTGERDTKLYTRNTHINMGLWALVMDVLHSIGSYARSLGSVYVHTDGYILEAWHAEELKEEIQTWGLNSSIKAAGVSVVLGMGNYRVGDKATKAYGQSGINGGVDNIYRTRSDELKAKMRHISRVRPLKLARQEKQSMRE